MVNSVAAGVSHCRMGHGVGLPAFIATFGSLHLFGSRDTLRWTGCNRIKTPCSRIRIWATAKSGGSDEWNEDLRVLSNKIRTISSSYPAPTPEFLPQDVISFTLNGLQANDNPVKDSGSSLLLRFSSDKFKLQMRWLIGTSQSPAVLSSSLRKKESQFHLLLCPYQYSFPSDTYYSDANRAFQEVQFDGCPDALSGQTLLAKLGWELVRGDDGCWRTDAISWHDFRDEFRPGIGQEEWPRICG